MFNIIGKDFISEVQINTIQVPGLEIVKDTIDIHWERIAELLELKLINSCLSMYENKDGKFILTKYGFIKQKE